MRQCTHKNLQTSNEAQLEGPGIFIALGGSYLYLPSNLMPHEHPAGALAMVMITHLVF